MGQILYVKKVPFCKSGHKIQQSQGYKQRSSAKTSHYVTITNLQALKSMCPLHLVLPFIFIQALILYAYRELLVGTKKVMGMNHEVNSPKTSHDFLR